MVTRRGFIQTIPVIGVGGLVPDLLTATSGSTETTNSMNHREYWIDLLKQISDPVLSAASKRQLKALMPVETTTGNNDKPSTYLEAVGRLLAGISCWLELDSGSDEEIRLRKGYRGMALEAIASIVDPGSPDYLFDHMEPQMLVDAAFLAHAFLRAPQQLWKALPADARKKLIACFNSTREVKPYYSNWLLFSAMIEAFFLKNDLPCDKMRLDLSVRKHQEWYLGDGMYGDGPDFHWDYYNSYVIQPMLMDIVSLMAKKEIFDPLETERIAVRFKRYAAIQERLISPEGAFPPIGRSITYRMGAFQHLAQAAMQNRLPDEINPAQVRCALTSVMQRLMSAPGTFDEQGWLQIGLCGHQNSLGETYISTGSLYLCSTALLPLGLPESHEFWSRADAPWTSVRIWNGEDLNRDHAL